MWFLIIKSMSAGERILHCGKREGSKGSGRGDGRSGVSNLEEMLVKKIGRDDEKERRDYPP